MDIARLLSDQAQAFITDNQFRDSTDLMLAQGGPEGIPMRDLVQQIKGRQVAREKIPSWYSNPRIIYGASKSLEQCSSEITATYKREIISSGQTLVDLTGGFGVDSYFMGQKFQQITLLEPDALLCQLVKNNFSVLGFDQAQVVNMKAEDFLVSAAESVDLIYVDPDRRPGARREFRVEDCEPNVIDLLPVLFERTSRLMIKLSPMFDIDAALTIFPQTKAVHVVSVRNECKELILLLERGYKGKPKMVAADFMNNQQWRILDYQLDQEKDASSRFSKPLKYLYQPNASIMKLGPYKWIGEKFQLYKLNPNSHLYTADHLVGDFPGRIFGIEWVSPYKPKILAKMLPGKANVSTRNFTIDVKTIRKQCKLSDGGEDYLFATRDYQGKPIVINGHKLSSE